MMLRVNNSICLFAVATLLNVMVSGLFVAAITIGFAGSAVAQEDESHAPPKVRVLSEQQVEAFDDGVLV